MKTSIQQIMKLLTQYREKMPTTRKHLVLHSVYNEQMIARKKKKKKKKTFYHFTTPLACVTVSFKYMNNQFSRGWGGSVLTSSMADSSMRRGASAESKPCVAII